MPRLKAYQNRHEIFRGLISSVLAATTRTSWRTLAVTLEEPGRRIPRDSGTRGRTEHRFDFQKSQRFPKKPRTLQLFVKA